MKNLTWKHKISYCGSLQWNCRKNNITEPLTLGLHLMQKCYL
jgi:hypothetical protein